MSKTSSHPPLDYRWPSSEDLRQRARQRIPRFAFEYLDGGCNEDVNLRKNTSELRQVELRPNYLNEHRGSDLRCALFGQTYDAPFGVAPVGLQGLMWPRSPEILARAAHAHNAPFVLSTVTTMDIERAGELTDGRFWFQLYHPKEDRIRDDLIRRAEAAGCSVLVVLCDVPTFGYRPRDMRNGLAMPPRMTLRNVLQMVARPGWSWASLKAGQPNFASLKPYMPQDLDLGQLGQFMNETFSGRLTADKIGPIRDMWRGKLVIKGIATEEDAEEAIRLGLDGIWVSNHGGRQLDAGESTIKPLQRIARLCKDRATLMMDSGIRSGPDVARALASGADFCFLGRTFMYSVAALGDRGGEHAMAMLKMQLQQVMEQICCERVQDLSRHLHGAHGSARSRSG